MRDISFERDSEGFFPGFSLIFEASHESKSFLFGLNLKKNGFQRCSKLQLCCCWRFIMINTKSLGNARLRTRYCHPNISRHLHISELLSFSFFSTVIRNVDIHDTSRKSFLLWPRTCVSYVSFLRTPHFTCVIVCNNRVYRTFVRGSQGYKKNDRIALALLQSNTSQLFSYVYIYEELRIARGNERIDGPSR